MIFTSSFLAQAGSQAAADVINQSLNLQSGITESWNNTWLSLLTPNDVSLWTALVSGASTIGLLVLIYTFIKYGNEVSKTQYLGTVIEMFIFPITVVVFLGNNGFFLARTILLLRSFFESVLQDILEIQLAGIKFGIAIQQIQLNSLGTLRVRQLINECDGLISNELQECFTAKTAEAQAIAEFITGVNPDINTSPLQSFIDTVLQFTVVGGVSTVYSFLQGGFTAVIQDKIFPIIQTLLYALQWAFINCLEAAILLTAVLAPFALVLSLLPVAGKPIWALTVAFISLYGIKLGYIISVGIVAVVLVNAEGNAAEIATDYGFTFFVSFFSPFIATTLASWGGIALFQGISRRATSITTALAGGTSNFISGGKKFVFGR